MSDVVLDYHQEEIDRHKKEQEEAFNKASALCQKYGMPWEVFIDEFIPIWVDGTYAGEQTGWHKYGKITHEMELEKANA